MTQHKYTVLIVPGLRDHVEEHWQTYLAQNLPNSITVPSLTENKLDLKARVEAIQNQVSQITGPILIVAHSAGVLMTIHWASRHASNLDTRVIGALLVSPPDITASWPSQYPSPATLKQNGWSPIPDETLPFAALVVGSTNDYLASFSSVKNMAENWGCKLHNAGSVGHLNPASGYGEWPQVFDLIAKVERQVALRKRYNNS